MANKVTFCVILICSLFSLIWFPLRETVGSLIDRQLVIGSSEASQINVDFDRVDSEKPHFTISMKTRANIGSIPKLGFLMSTDIPQSELKLAQIRIRGTSCFFRTDSDSILQNGRVLEFFASPDCLSLVQHQKLFLDFSMDFANASPTAKLALTVIQFKNESTKSGILPVLPETTPTNLDDGPAYPIGHFVTRMPPPFQTREDLLKFMWHLAPDSLRVREAIFMGLLFVAAGLVLIVFRKFLPKLTRLRLPLAFSCFFLGLTSTYAILVPPFHGPDEPSHLISMGVVYGDYTLSDKALALANLGHFERLKFHPTERFQATDRNEPLKSGWTGTIGVYDPYRRSALGIWFTQIISPFVKDMALEDEVLFIRLILGLLVAVAVGAAAFLLQDAPGQSPSHRTLLYFVIPSLPFFAMHISNYPILIACGIVASALFLRQWLTPAKSSLRLVFVTGIMLGLMLCTSLSALTIICISVAGILFESIYKLKVVDNSFVKARLVTWTSFSAGLACGLLPMTPQYALTVAEALSSAAGLNALGWLARQSPLLTSVLFGIMGFCGDLLLAFLFKKCIEFLDSQKLTFRIGAAIACGVGLMMALSLFLHYPHLPDIEKPDHISLHNYLIKSTSVLMTFFRIRDPDFYTSTSFWVGFGWLETIPPAFFVDCLAGLAGLGLIFQFLQKDARKLISLCCAGVSIFGAVMISTAANYHQQQNLHGRYLIVTYLFLLSLCFSGLQPAAERLKLKIPRLQTFLTLPVYMTALLCMHFCCLAFILRRYF